MFSDNSNSYITKLNDDEFEVRMPIPEGFKGKQVKVYYVDSNRDRFLVVKYNGYFIWVDTKDCKLKED